MRYRKLSPLGDFTIGTGADYFVDNEQAVAQAILTRLKLFSGEWFLDTTDGTPWRTAVLGKYTRNTYEAVLKLRILGTPGVLSVLSFSSSFNGSNRTVTFKGTVNTVYGVVPFSGSL